ncbi:MAG: NUDIX domain-containing protein [Chlamydiales bacterium]|nr:NUDIX domain-containing protein [Chlamydiales bacterium]
MYKNLIEEAHKEGLEKIIIETIIQKDGKVLLIEALGMGDSFYEFPNADLKEDEGISQALERAVTQKTAMQLKDVKRYLGHYDKEGIRHYHFVVEVKDPYSLEDNATIAYAWLDVQEAVGYPITDELREMLDLYNKT